MKKTNRNIIGAIVASTVLASCGPKGLQFNAEPLRLGDLPEKNQELSEEELKSWSHADLLTDTIPGMSVNRAYEELIRDQEGETVIVGVIDSGIDNEHEDLASVMWVNPNEIPGNGIDDDKNGFVDDVYGWNFLGDIVEENLEYTRIVRDFEDLYGDDPSQASQEEKTLYEDAKAEYEKERKQSQTNYNRYLMLLTNLQRGEKNLKTAIGVDQLSIDRVREFETDSTQLMNDKNFMLNIMTNAGENLEEVYSQLDNAMEYFQARLDSHFKKDLYARANNLGDDENDFSVTIYGNNQVSGPDPKKEDAKHGTHVAGIIAANRTNDKGAKGVAQNVQILSVRAVPDGDEYDKDIALAFRYAVDNGAKVINTSFGKYFSTHPEKVMEAIKYAAEHDVLIVNAAGNEGLDLDEKQVYPNDQNPKNTTEIADNFLNVGSITPAYGKAMVSGFSNYGKLNVDIFAPGSQIYASTPLDTYEFLQGTSMASPAVAGVAALIRSYYPKLTAAQVKQVIMDSGLAFEGEVIVSGDPNKTMPFSELSVSGKIANLYNALILADEQ
ncbi:S8 family peptidase [Psychroflexus salis]|uniref:Peptidase S8 n=1 Tax=Psychroflexus salis TaxID=1526574 RepID=A0A916ZRD1_9FLAO|nr:S8 family peptidase [Psychroflexus salis]GGE08560.1 peptidase S8 [Psychroflexus salis]